MRASFKHLMGPCKKMKSFSKTQKQRQERCYRKVHIVARRFLTTVATHLTTRKVDRLFPQEMVGQWLFGKPLQLDNKKLLYILQDPSHISLPKEACPDHLHGPAGIQHLKLDPLIFYISSQLFTCLFLHLHAELIWDKGCSLIVPIMMPGTEQFLRGYQIEKKN